MVLPMFSTQLDLEINKLSNERITHSSIYTDMIIKMNGINSLLLQKAQSNYKLTRLICFLNPEGPRKILKKHNFSKANLIESTSINGKKHGEKMEYSHIEICLKFENPGNYFIIVFNHFNVGWLQFYVKIKKAKEEKCVFKMFKKITDFDKNILKDLRQRIGIYLLQTQVDDIENGVMNVYTGNLFEKHPETEYVAAMSPLLIDGSYEFYLDRDGITKERMKIVEF
ncbi:unnamed protein product [Meloidogyne enterolobii]|uniref:Uncharacterized protein n=1 Tax=Meloidogyne enterolobii TaxID=390850 RepID=A0ACB0YEB9_MELEN